MYLLNDIENSYQLTACAASEFHRFTDNHGMGPEVVEDREPESLDDVLGFLVEADEFDGDA